MQYIAAIDYDHLDNGVFLTSLARSLAQQQENKDVRSIIVHADSKYTERIIQTGVMRNEARIRSVKDLNNRLVALFADQGVSTVGINPNQRNFIELENNILHIDHSFLDTLPSASVLLLSTLVHDVESQEPTVVELPKLTKFLYEELQADQLFIFSKSEEAEIFTNSQYPKKLEWNSLDSNFRKEQIPDECSNFQNSIHLTTARDFKQLPDLDKSI
jgi:hypothetical protein